MTCLEVEQELVAYHLGAVTPAGRAAVEAHLPTCPSCVRSFLVLGRELEPDEDELPLPSDAARARLRAAVAGHLRPAPAPWAWWQRPFAFASAAVVVAGAVVLTFRIATSEVNRPRSVAARTGASVHAGGPAKVAAPSLPPVAATSG